MESREEGEGEGLREVTERGWGRMKETGPGEGVGGQQTERQRWCWGVQGERGGAVTGRGCGRRRGRKEGGGRM